MVALANMPPWSGRAVTPAGQYTYCLATTTGVSFFWGADMDAGWVKLHRKIRCSQVFSNPELLKVWVWCLTKANHSDVWVPISTGRGTTEILVGRGQFILGRNSAAKELKMKPRTLYDRINKLAKMKNIAMQPNTHYTLVSVCNFETYQSVEEVDQQATRQPTNRQPTAIRLPSNTNKNEENDNNEKNEKRETLPLPKINFIDELCDLFSIEYLRSKGIEYIIQDKDKKAMGMLLAGYKKKNPESNSDKCKQDFNNLFRGTCSISDEKFLSQITISLLNSQINQYLNYLRNGKANKSQSEYSKGFDIRKNTWITGS